MVYWLDLGEMSTLLRSELEKLGVDGFHLHVDRIKKAQFGELISMFTFTTGRKIRGLKVILITIMLIITIMNIIMITSIITIMNTIMITNTITIMNTIITYSHADARSYADIHDLIAASQLSHFFVKQKKS